MEAQRQQLASQIAARQPANDSARPMTKPVKVSRKAAPVHH